MRRSPTAKPRLTLVLAPLLAVPGVLVLFGCISSSNPSAPEQNTTIVVPPGSSAISSDGIAPPCR